ncbi:MAG: hypothetical protein Kow0060_06200 [Methylohalobius crimeensis]
MTTTPEAILRAELDSAERMIFHLKRSYSQAATLLPLSSQQMAKLTDDEIDRLDLYLSRFGKLQDFKCLSESQHVFRAKTGPDFTDCLFELFRRERLEREPFVFHLTP